MKVIKRNLAILLAACLVITSVVPAFATEIPEQQTETVNEIIPEEATPNEATYGSEAADPENEEIEKASPSDAKKSDSEVFIREATVDGVTITLTADSGVFPEEAELSVETVEDEKTEEAIEEAVEKERDEAASVASSYKFDIKMLVNGEEVQPDTSKGTVKVAFKLAEKVNDCLEVNAYHLKEDAKGKLTAETLDTEVKTVEEPETENAVVTADEDGVLPDGDIEDDVTKEVTEIEAETDGFSYYVVEFTYDKLQYVLPGDSSIKLSVVLEALAIKGIVSEANVSNETLFTVEKDEDGDDWTVTALQAFSSKEWMKLTMDDGEKYEIVVTDDSNVCKIGSTGYATLEAAISAVTNGQTITMLQDVTYGTPLTINNGKTFTIDFDDSSSTHTFIWNVTEGQAYQQDIIIIEGNSNVTVKNMKFSVGGTDEQGNRIFKVNSTGKLTLNNMTLNSEDSIRNTPVQNNGGTVVIDGGNITTNQTNLDSINPNALNPVVQNLGGTTTFTGNGTYTMKNSNTGAAWLGRVITRSSLSTDDDRDSECGTVIIENGTFNTGQIVDVNGKGIITINDATYGTGDGPVIKTFHGGIKSNITINNITTSAMYFSQVIEDLQTKINFQNGNVKYMPNYFCFRNATMQQMTSVSIKNGKFGPKTGSDDIRDEIEGFLATGATLTALSGDSDGYTYQVETETGNFTELQAAIDSTSSAGTLSLEKDYTAQSDEVAIIIKSEKTITIDLNGHTIDRNLTEAKSSGNVITVKGTLTVEDNSTAGTGKITGGNTTGSGGGVYIWSGGTFTLNGGSIEDNEINSNYGYGGGVSIDGTFIMTGGSITNNRANGTEAGGGGVYVVNTGTFTMTGGSITGNFADRKGGGVLFNSTAFKMTGGSIMNNTAIEAGGGVYFYTTTGIMTVGGNAEITGNSKGTGDTKTANNAYIPVNRYITIGTDNDKPIDGMKIGVTTGTAPTEETPRRITTNGTTDDVKYFSADNDAYEVKFNGNYLELAVKTTPSHTHTFAYAASNNKLTATCTEGCNEGYNTKPLTLTLTAPVNLVYDGNPKGVAFTYDEESRWRSAGLKLPGIIYYIKPSGQSGYELMEGLPTDAGDYKAQTTVNGATAELEFAIKKAASESFIVTFIYRNGQENKKVEVPYNEKVAKPADPVMTGYTFDAWCSDNECRIEYDFSKPVTGNLSLYARWKKNAGTENSSSGTNSIYTGTTSYPVSDGKWIQNADGTWSYVAGRRFTSTWGYIANPAEVGKANWYYFDSYGKMLTGWQKLYWNGAYRWFYFSKKNDGTYGACQLGGVTPDGYRVGADGAWIEK